MNLILSEAVLLTSSSYFLSFARATPAIVALNLISRVLNHSTNSRTFLTGAMRPRNSTELGTLDTDASGLKKSVSIPTGISVVFLKRAVKECGEVQKTLPESNTARQVHRPPRIPLPIALKK